MIMNSYINFLGFSPYSLLKSSEQFGPKLLDADKIFDSELIQIA